MALSKFTFIKDVLLENKTRPFFGPLLQKTQKQVSLTPSLSLFPVCGTAQDPGTAGWKQAPPLSGSETSDHTHLSWQITLRWMAACHKAPPLILILICALTCQSYVPHYPGFTHRDNRYAICKVTSLKRVNTVMRLTFFVRVTWNWASLSVCPNNGKQVHVCESLIFQFLLTLLVDSEITHCTFNSNITLK